MDSLLPSEKARLVLGFLEEEDCLDSYKTFLGESKHLSECLSVSRQGKKFSTRVIGRTLNQILDEYCSLQALVEEYAIIKSLNRSSQTLAHFFKELLESEEKTNNKSNNLSNNNNNNINNNNSNNSIQTVGGGGNQQTLFFRINVQQHGSQSNSDLSTSTSARSRTRSQGDRQARGTLKRSERRSLSGGSSVENQTITINENESSPTISLQKENETLHSQVTDAINIDHSCQVPDHDTNQENICTEKQIHEKNIETNASTSPSTSFGVLSSQTQTLTEIVCPSTSTPDIISNSGHSEETFVSDPKSSDQPTSTLNNDSTEIKNNLKESRQSNSPKKKSTKRKYVPSPNKQPTPVKRPNIKEDFLVLSDMFLKNQPLQDKIAESINKALQDTSSKSQEMGPSAQSTPDSKGQGNSKTPPESIASSSNHGTTNDETIKSIVNETEKDPAFAAFLEQYIENLSDELNIADPGTSVVTLESTNSQENKSTNELPIKQRLRNSNKQSRNSITTTTLKKNKATPPTNKKQLDDMNQLAIQGIINSGLDPTLPISITPIKNSSQESSLPNSSQLLNTPSQISFPISILSPSIDRIASDQLFAVPETIGFSEPASCNLLPYNINNTINTITPPSTLTTSTLHPLNVLTQIQTPSRISHLTNISHSPFDIDKFCLEKCTVEIKNDNVKNSSNQEKDILETPNKQEMTLKITEKEIIVVPTVIIDCPRPENIKNSISKKNITSCANNTSQKPIPEPKTTSNNSLTSVVVTNETQAVEKSDEIIMLSEIEQPKKTINKKTQSKRGGRRARFKYPKLDITAKSNESFIIFPKNYQIQNQPNSGSTQKQITLQPNKSLEESSEKLPEQLNAPKLNPEKNVNNDPLKQSQNVENESKKTSVSSSLPLINLCSEKTNQVVINEDLPANLIAHEQMKETPQARILNTNIGRSHSTPRRKSNHVRALEFTTPNKKTEGSIRKVNTSPKAASNKRFHTERGSPQNNRGRNRVKFRGSLFKSPSPEKVTSVPEKTSNPEKIVSKSPNKIIPTTTIATRSPATPLSGAWDKVTGIGSMLLNSNQSSPSEMNPSPIKKFLDSELQPQKPSSSEENLTNSKCTNNIKEQSNKNDLNSQAKLIEQALSEPIKKTAKNKKEKVENNKKKIPTRKKPLKSWDSDLRALCVLNAEENLSNFPSKENPKTPLSKENPKKPISQGSKKQDQDKFFGIDKEAVVEIIHLKELPNLKNNKITTKKENLTNIKKTILSDDTNKEEDISTKKDENISDIPKLTNEEKDSSINNNNKETSKVENPPSEISNSLMEIIKNSNKVNNINEETNKVENPPEISNNIMEIIKNSNDSEKINIPPSLSNNPSEENIIPLLEEESSKKELNSNKVDNQKKDLNSTSIELSENKELIIPSGSQNSDNEDCGCSNSSCSSDSDSSDSSEWDSSSSSTLFQTPKKAQLKNNESPKPNFIPMTPRALTPVKLVVPCTPLPPPSISCLTTHQQNLTHIQTPLFPPTPKIIATPNNSECPQDENRSSPYFQPTHSSDQPLIINRISDSSLVKTLIGVCQTLESDRKTDSTDDESPPQFPFTASQLKNISDLEKKRLRTCKKLKELDNQNPKKIPPPPAINRKLKSLQKKRFSQKSTGKKIPTQTTKKNSSDKTKKIVKKSPRIKVIKKTKEEEEKNESITVNSLGLELTESSESELETKKKPKAKKPQTKKNKEIKKFPKKQIKNNKTKMSEKNRKIIESDLLKKQKALLEYEVVDNDLGNNQNKESEAISNHNIKISLKKVSKDINKTENELIKNNEIEEERSKRENDDLQLKNSKDENVKTNEKILEENLIEPNKPSEEWSTDPHHPILTIKYKGLGIPRVSYNPLDFDPAFESIIDYEDFQVNNTISPFIDLLNLEPNEKKENNSSEESNRNKTKQLVNIKKEKLKEQLKGKKSKPSKNEEDSKNVESNLKEKIGEAGTSSLVTDEDLSCNNIIEAESSTSNENKNLPPKKRKASNDDLLPNEKIMRSLKALDLDTFLNRLHGQDE